MHRRTLLLLAATLLLPLSPGRAQPETGGAPVLEIAIDPSKRFQRIDGWGTCLITWKRELRRLYNRNQFVDFYARELGCNILRINLWPNVSPEPVEDPAGIRHQDFTFAGDADRLLVFVAFAKALRERNPDALLIGTVWSPPAWMKHSNNINDDHSGAIHGDAYVEEKSGNTLANRLDMTKLPHFAAWLVEMVRYFDAQGVPLNALSIANEPQFTQWYESCVWTAEDYAKAVRAVGEAMEAAGYGDVRIFGPETMTAFNWPKANPLYIRKLTEDPAVAKHFDIFATHGYTDGVAGDVSKQSSWQFAKLIETHRRPYWLTEGGTGGHDWPAPVHGMAMALHNALVHGGASAVVPWQITDEKPDDGSLMHMGEPTAKTHVARQWFKFVRPGAVRIAATPSDEQRVHASAFVHDADKTLTIVLVNTSTTPRDVRLALPPGVTELSAVRTNRDERSAEQPAVAVTNGTAALSLPPLAVVTFQAKM